MSGLHVNEINKAIMDIENKKKTIALASNNEQNAIKQKIHELHGKIGEASYPMYVSGNFEVEKLADMFELLRSLHQTLDEKRAKLDEILGRYDEELKILRPAPAAGQAACKNCGTPFIPGEMLFCTKCGSSLPDKAPDLNQASSTQQPVCPSCGTVYVIGEMLFCKSCGTKLPEQALYMGGGNLAVSNTSNCQKCNAALVPGSLFCNSCGTKVSAGEGIMLTSVAGAVAGVAVAATALDGDGESSQGSDLSFRDVKRMASGIASVASLFGIGDGGDYDEEDDYDDDSGDDDEDIIDEDEGENN